MEVLLRSVTNDVVKAMLQYMQSREQYSQSKYVSVYLYIHKEELAHKEESCSRPRNDYPGKLAEDGASVHIRALKEFPNARLSMDATLHNL